MSSQTPDVGDLSLEENDNAWELEEGIPQPHDQVIQKYFQGRDALIAQEDKQRSDATFRETLSPMAQEACSIVSQIRFEEQQTVWATDPNSGLNLFPGMNFTLAKQRLQQTKLFEIVKKMPKGALLHCHLEAMVDLEWIFHEGLATEGIHISSAQSLHTEAARRTEMVIFQYTKALSSPNQSLWSESYVAGSWVPIQAAADSYPGGGRDAFVQWLISRASITADDAARHQEGPDKIWAKFISCFSVLRTLIFYEPIYRKFLARFFKQLNDDLIRYVDIRAAFAFEYRKTGSEKPEEGYDEPIRVLGEEIDKFKATESGKSFWGARMIWTTIRSFDKKTIFENMLECIETKLAYPHLIAGFDLVGYENLGAPLADLVPLLFQFRKMCAQEKVDIPFYLHAGETTSTGTSTDHNLFDAFMLGSRRLGHAFSIYKHPLLMNMSKEKGVCVECCPVSNEVLRFTSDMSTHPLPAMLAHGVPVALCNDDPAILGQGDAGLSFDFWQALQAIESLGLEGLGAMAENSVRYASLEDCDAKHWAEDIKNGTYGQGLRAERLKEWKKEWERYCQWIVMEHGVDVDLEEQD